MKTTTSSSSSKQVVLPFKKRFSPKTTETAPHPLYSPWSPSTTTGKAPRPPYRPCSQLEAAADALYSMKYSSTTTTTTTATGDDDVVAPGGESQEQNDSNNHNDCSYNYNYCSPTTIGSSIDDERQYNTRIEAKHVMDAAIRDAIKKQQLESSNAVEAQSNTLQRLLDVQQQLIPNTGSASSISNISPDSLGEAAALVFSSNNNNTSTPPQTTTALELLAAARQAQQQQQHRMMGATTLVTGARVPGMVRTTAFSITEHSPISTMPLLRSPIRFRFSNDDSDDRPAPRSTTYRPRV